MVKRLLMSNYAVKSIFEMTPNVGGLLLGWYLKNVAPGY